MLGRYFFAQETVKRMHTTLPSPSLISRSSTTPWENLRMAPWEEQLLSSPIALEHLPIKIVMTLLFLRNTSSLWHYSHWTSTSHRPVLTALYITRLHYSLEPLWPCFPGGTHRLNKTLWDLVPWVGNRFAVNFGKIQLRLISKRTLLFSESFLRGIWSAFKVKWSYLWVTVKYWEEGVIQKYS